MERYLTHQVLSDLKDKMVFLGGPRQVGKTTLALGLLRSDSEKDAAYFNWDSRRGKEFVRNSELPNEPLIVLDEIHKYKHWRNFVKGLFDTNRSSYRFLITGSARLDYYRRGGDSLQGRYHFLRLHPLSLDELSKTPSHKDFATLLRFGGFPEPYFAGSEVKWQRWQNERMDRIVQEDLLTLERVREISQIQLLLQSLPSRVGSKLSIKSLQEDLHVAFETVEKWILIFENLYVCFRIPPYSTSLFRTAKKERKLYLWDWSACESEGAKFENMVASHLLKFCHYRLDSKGEKWELRFLKDSDGNELDFLLLKNGKIECAIECKLGEIQVPPQFARFVEKLKIRKAYVVHSKDQHITDGKTGIESIPFWKWCGKFGTR